MSATGTIDGVNIALMLGALFASCVMPFELVLFSYAFLGPLHYLTEISWLHDRGYFTARKLDFLPLAGAAALLVVGSFVLEKTGHPEYEYWFADLTLGSVLLAVMFVVARTWRARSAGLLLIGLVLAATRWVGVRDAIGFHNLLMIFLPTVVHICVFTGAFIMLGALRSRSRIGYASLGVFVACCLLSFLLPTEAHYVSASTREAFTSGGFHIVTAGIGYHLGYGPAHAESVFSESIYVAGARFLAFAYTYHYLNWFSKTRIIRWHEVPAWRFAVVLAIWIAAIVVYAIDFGLGFRVLLLLSVMHVFLEFPLNYRSFVGIGHELGARLRGARVVSRA